MRLQLYNKNKKKNSLSLLIKEGAKIATYDVYNIHIFGKKRICEIDAEQYSKMHSIGGISKAITRTFYPTF